MLNPINEREMSKHPLTHNAYARTTASPTLCQSYFNAPGIAGIFLVNKQEWEGKKIEDTEPNINRQFGTPEKRQELKIALAVEKKTDKMWKRDFSRRNMREKNPKRHCKNKNEKKNERKCLCMKKSYHQVSQQRQKDSIKFTTSHQNTIFPFPSAALHSIALRCRNRKNQKKAYSFSTHLCDTSKNEWGAKKKQKIWNRNQKTYIIVV